MSRNKKLSTSATLAIHQLGMKIAGVKGYTTITLDGS